MTLILLNNWLEKKVPSESILEAKRRGLVPQSGNWDTPKRWVTPQDAEKDSDDSSIWSKFLSTGKNAHSILSQNPLGILSIATHLGNSDIKKIHSDIDKAIGNLKYKLSEADPKKIGEEVISSIKSTNPVKAFRFMAEHDLLKYIHPKLDLTVGWPQNSPNHRFDVWGHNLSALEWIVNESSMKDNAVLRLSAFLHDIGKPDTANEDSSHFPDHHHVGADITKLILDKLSIPDDIKNDVVNIVDQHMFIHMFGGEGKGTAEDFKGFTDKVGSNVDLLYELARADTVGRGHPDTDMEKIEGKIANTKEQISNLSKSTNSIAILNEWLEKVMPIGMPKRYPTSRIGSMPPGLPPRPNLTWKPSTHRWIRRDKDDKKEKEKNVQTETRLQEITDYIEKGGFAEGTVKLGSILQDLFSDSSVSTRIKGVGSIQEKEQRKKYKDKGMTYKDFTDIVGGRVGFDSVNEVMDAVDTLHNKQEELGFKIIEDENHMLKPLDGYYRRYHMLLQMDNEQGEPITMELQLGTENQTAIADWAHDLLHKNSDDKPVFTPNDRKKILQYIRGMADYYGYKDGAPGAKEAYPVDCIEVVKKFANCLEI